jgi:hypothetical protein
MADIWATELPPLSAWRCLKLAASRRSAPHAVSEAGVLCYWPCRVSLECERCDPKRKSSRSRGVRMLSSCDSFARRFESERALTVAAHFRRVGKCLWTFCHNVRAVRAQRRPFSGAFGKGSVSVNVVNGSMPLPDRKTKPAERGRAGFGRIAVSSCVRPKPSCSPR